MNEVRERMESVGIFLTSWHGAGAVAGKVLQREGIKAHIVRPIAEAENEAIMSAYFGGRNLCQQVGYFDKVYGYDIVSAYPSAMRTLPSLKGLEAIQLEGLIDYPLSCYFVEWNFPQDSAFIPLPFRHKDGSIYYQERGKGWYWYPEVKECLRHFPNNIRIISGYQFKVQNPDSRPFNFINEIFEERRMLKEAGNRAQYALKLAINSLYGKTAQSVGYRGMLPPYQSYIYAGMITSITRAKMIAAAMQNPEAIIFFATDGILSTAPLELPLGTELGEYETTEWDSSFVVKSGFYELCKGDKVKRTVRGFAPSIVSWDLIKDAFNELGLSARVPFEVTEFIGMKSSSKERPWLTWQQGFRVLSFLPARQQAKLIQDYPLRYRLYPAPSLAGKSAPYVKRVCEENEPVEYDVLADGVD
jgi:DNA polymerase elongation subunit (family B)